VSVEEATAVNLVPMVDIMFLMLLFFMLGADMGQRELEAVELPVAVTVTKDCGDAPKEGRTTINVYHATRGCPDFAGGGVCRNEGHWQVGVRGSDFDVRNEKDLGRLRALLISDGDLGRARPGGLSERAAMIRGDKSAPYGVVQRVMMTCAEAKIYKIESGAAAPAPR
jgi:biopolymer transport protein ExbD